MVNDVRAAVGRATTLDELGHALVSTLRDAITFERFNIGLIEQSTYQFHDVFVYGNNVAGRSAGHRRTLNGTVVEQAMQSAEGYYFGHHDLPAWLERFPGFAPVYESGIRSMLAVPIHDQREVLASLVFASDNPHAYKRPTLLLVEAVAAAMPIQLLRLN